MNLYYTVSIAVQYVVEWKRSHKIYKVQRTLITVTISGYRILITILFFKSI